MGVGVPGIPGAGAGEARGAGPSFHFFLAWPCVQDLRDVTAEQEGDGDPTVLPPFTPGP